MTSSETELEPRLLPRLTAFRWYAALAVFLYHLGKGGELVWRPLRLFTIGQAGVSFFFVLSGFVLTWSIRADPAPSRFYRRRFARIYPATAVTWFVAAIVLRAGWFGLRHGTFDFTTGPLGAVTSLLFLQAWFPGQTVYPVYSYNPVAWTLSCEAFFYLLLPFLVIGAARVTSRTVVAVTAATTAVGLATTTVLVHLGRSDIAFNDPLVRLPEFLVGVTLGILVVRGWRPRLPIWQALALLLAGAVAAHHWTQWFPLEDYLLLPGFAALLVSGIGSDTRARKGWLTGRVSVYLGELSFCFYLVHFLVLHALVGEMGWHRFSLAGGVGPILVALAACATVAAVLHHSVELPMQQLLRPKPPPTHTDEASL